MSPCSFWGSGSCGRGALVKRRQSEKVFPASVHHIQHTLFLWAGFFFPCARSQQLWKQLKTLASLFGQMIPFLPPWGSTSQSQIFWWQLSPSCDLVKSRKQICFLVCDWCLFCCLALSLPRVQSLAFQHVDWFMSRLKFGNYCCHSSLPDFYFPGISFQEKKSIIYCVFSILVWDNKDIRIWTVETFVWFKTSFV